MYVEISGDMTFYFDFSIGGNHTLSIFEEGGSSVEINMNDKELEELRGALESR